MLLDHPTIRGLTAVRCSLLLVPRRCPTPPRQVSRNAKRVADEAETQERAMADALTMADMTRMSAIDGEVAAAHTEVRARDTVGAPPPPPWCDDDDDDVDDDGSRSRRHTRNNDKAARTTTRARAVRV